MKTKIFLTILSFTVLIFSSCVKDTIYDGPPTVKNVMINPIAPGATDDVLVSAEVRDLKGISSVKMFYKVSTDPDFTEVPMSEGTDAVYTATIPSFPLNTIIYYYIEAINNNSLKTVYPETSPETTSAYTVGAPSIVINEIFSRGTASDPDWVEIYNNSGNSVDISGYKIYDPGGQSGAKEKMVFPDGTIISAHGYFVVVVDDATTANPAGSSFGLSSSGDEVWLESAAGFVIDYVALPAIPDATDSYGRKPDGSVNWEILNTITRNAPNSATAPEISNFGISPASPGASDAVTVTATVTDLQGLTSVKLYYKVDAGNYTSLSMTAAGNDYSAIIPAQVSGSVVSYYVEAVNSVPLTTFAPETAPANAASYTVTSPSSITNFAKSPLNPTSVESVTVSATVNDVQGINTVKLYYKVDAGSYSSVDMTAVGNDYSAIIPAQNGGSVVSYYIEVINSVNITSYAPVTAPATPESYTVAGPILMNEIFARGSAGDLDWIEIYNTSNASVDISGYKIYDSGGQGGTKPKMEFPAGTVVPALGFFVIVVDDATIDYPDGSSFGLSSSGESVWLENASGTVIDTILFGTTVDATQSYGRQPDGTSTWKVLTTITKGATNGTKK